MYHSNLIGNFFTSSNKIVLKVGNTMQFLTMQAVHKENCLQSAWLTCFGGVSWLENSLRESGFPLKEFPSYKDADREKLMIGII